MTEQFLEMGMVGWPLLVCSGVALAIVVERGLFWLRIWLGRDPNAVRLIAEDLKAGERDRAAATAAGSRDAVARVAAAGSLGEVELAARSEIERARRGLGVLETIVAVAPLLGILGTIAGVIDVFDSIGAGGIRSAAEMEGVMRGIGKALITTAAGLTIAIPSLVAYNGLLSLVRRHALAIEQLATRLEQPGEVAHAAD